MAGTPARRSRLSGRLGPAIGVAAVHAVLGLALVAGLRVAPPVRIAEDAMSLIVVDLKPPPPPPPEPPREPRPASKQGGSSSAPTARPRDAAVPPAPIPPLLVPAPPVMAGFPPSGDGMGEGAGGTGSGQGRGQGEGLGVGDGRGFSGARQIRGRFRNSDFPSSAKAAGRLTIGVRYAVGPSGRVEHCEIIAPSGYPEVDAMTCRVIVERYRFQPARDEEGVPVTEVTEEDYTWSFD